MSLARTVVLRKPSTYTWYLPEKKIYVVPAREKNIHVVPARRGIYIVKVSVVQCNVLENLNI